MEPEHRRVVRYYGNITKNLIFDWPMLKKQVIRFLMVGVLNTVFGYSLYAVFIYIGLHYVLAILCSTILGILFNFKTIGALVFESDDNTLIFKFFLSYLVTFFINVWIISKFKDLEYDYYTAGFVAIVVSSSISFVLMKYLVFKK